MPRRPHKALIPLMRRLSDGGFHSGQDLANEFGLSRASVFNVLHQARAAGMAIYAVRGRGYHLAQQQNMSWLDQRLIQEQMTWPGDAAPLIVLDSVDSTNRYLMAEAVEGVPDGTVVVAEYQYAGRGRRGRVWHAAPGSSLTFSVLWRLDGGLQTTAGLSLVMGLAIVRALNCYSPHQLSLKWPNDILAHDRKLGGVLIEAQGDMHGSAFAVVGVGLNVCMRDSQRVDIDQAVVDLAELGVVADRNHMLAACLNEMQCLMQDFREQGFSALRESWAALDAYADKAVSLSMPDGTTINGIDQGVDERGALRIRLVSGEVRVFSSGEVSLRPGRCA